MRNFDHIIIHCSATPPDMDIGAEEIDRWHRRRGWKKCGYHAVIRRDGTIEQASTGHKTRTLNEAGAHVGDCGRGWNGRSLGICLIGGVDGDNEPDDNFTREQMASLEALVTHYQARFDVPDAHIMGHRDLIELTGASPKACPSFDVRTWWMTLGTDQPETPSDTTETLWIEHRVVHGDSLWALAQAHGTTVEGIMEANGLRDDLIRIGQVLKLPPN